MMSPEPNTDKVYSLLLQEERQRSIQLMICSPFDSSSFNVSVQKQMNYQGQGKVNFNTYPRNSNKFNTVKENNMINMFCNYCQKSGHTIKKVL